MTKCSTCNQSLPQAEETPPDGTGTANSFTCRVVDDLSLLHDISDTLSEGLELRVTALRMFERLRNTRKLERGLLLVLNRESGALIPEACADAMAWTMASAVNAHVGSGFIGGIIAEGRARAVVDIEHVPVESFCKWEREYLAETARPVSKVRSLLVIPIQHGQEVVGALCFTRPQADMKELETDLRFLSLVVGQVGLAVRLRQLVQERLESLREENTRLQDKIKRNFLPEGMVGKSSAMRQVYFHVDQVAEGKTAVLIRGETGVGKECVAQAIWQGSSRKARPFVRVNCAALPESIVESELFGHEKGAFTGALALRKGRFELAHTGTLFLDEIGEMSFSTQAKLLRVLQEGTFERVGGSAPIRVDVRVITATNRNLEAMIEEGKFRLDLYYRINVFPIYVPPLRERRSDLLELADHFLERYARQNSKRVVRISTPAIDMLTAYHWPGNVRELENVIERAVLLTTDDVVHGYHLPPTLQTAGSSGTASKQTLEGALATVEREMIVDALKSNGGVMARAARQLGITERMMGLRVKALGIDLKQFRKRDEAPVP